MTISVVIPVRNGAATLERCLKSLREQTKPPDEIIITDTASTDNSKEIAKRFGAKMIDIAEKDFDHGLTRNEGVAHCTSELIYLTVQDAWIADNTMLERMAKHFEDKEVMAVCGHQAVPHEKDKNPVRWYKRYSEYSVDVRQVKDAAQFRAMPQNEQAPLVAWDNVAAMYRKEALTELPFVQTEMSEDWMWSYQALQKGWKLLRDSSLEVYHYHHQTMRYVFRTTWSVNYHFNKFFGYTPSLPAVFLPTAKAAYHLFGNKALSFREKIYWSGHNFLASISTWISDFDFLMRLRLGGPKAIEGGYRKYCKKIPQGSGRKRPSRFRQAMEPSKTLKV